jgi:hypothetical protein
MYKHERSWREIPFAQLDIKDKTEDIKSIEYLNRQISLKKDAMKIITAEGNHHNAYNICQTFTGYRSYADDLFQNALYDLIRNLETQILCCEKNIRELIPSKLEVTTNDKRLRTVFSY